MVQLEAFELREKIEAIRSEGDLADAIELEKEIDSDIAREGETLDIYLDIAFRDTGAADVETLKRSAARLMYLSKALEEVRAIDEDYEHMP